MKYPVTQGWEEWVHNTLGLCFKEKEIRVNDCGVRCKFCGEYIIYPS